MVVALIFCPRDHSHVGLKVGTDHNGKATAAPADAHQPCTSTSFKSEDIKFRFHSIKHGESVCDN